MTVVDHGGPIIKNGRAQFIFWGSRWSLSTQNPTKAACINAFTKIFQGPYFTHLNQYRGIQTPQFLTPVTNPDATVDTAFPDSQVIQAIKDSVANFGAADVRQDPNVFYILIPTNGYNPVGTLAHHGNFVWNGVNVAYGVSVGTVPPNGNGNLDAELGVQTYACIHEVVEMLTDPQYGTNPAFLEPDAIGEICDYCTTIGRSGGFRCPGYNSNADGGCIIPDASVVTPPPGGGAGTDTFGIKKLYVDDTSKLAENWVMGDTNLTTDSRLRVDGSVTQISPGIYEGHVTTSDNPASFRINVNTTNPNAMDPTAQSVLGTHWDQMAAVGYMLDPRDFKNVEMTIYWKVTSWSDDDEMSLYARGGRHGSGWPEGCIGPCYKGQIQRAGNSRWAKEYHHASGNTGYVFTAGHNTSNLSARNNVWTGQKVVIFDKTVNGKKVVRMEVWKDEAGDSNPALQNWVMINFIEDSGSFGEPSDQGYVSNCHAIHQQMFTWGGPTATFRIDSVVVQVKKASVRNILPEGSTPDPTGCPAGQHFDTALGQCVNDNIPPPPPPGSDEAVPYIKFYNSGGVGNANPFNSIGGAISTTEIVPDAFNNLWDSLSIADQRAGKKSTRVLYAKNTDATVGLPDTKAYFGAVDKYTSMSLGATPKNTTETGVVTEVEEQIAYYALNTGLGSGVDFTEVQKLDNTVTKVADHFTGTTTPAFGKKITRYTIYARKVGTPTGTLTAKLLSSSDTVKMTFPNTFDVATAISAAGADFNTLVFLKADNTTIAVASGDRLSVEYPSGTASNYIEIAIKRQVQSPSIALDKWTGAAWVNIAGDPSTLASLNPPASPDLSADATTRITMPGHFVDRGGKVLSAARVVIIYWGNPPNKPQWDEHFQTMLSIPYFSKLRQYASIESPTFFGVYVNTRTPVKDFRVADLAKCVTDTITDHSELRPTTVNPFLYCVIPNGIAKIADVPGAGGYHTWANSSFGRIYFTCVGGYTHDQLHYDYVTAGTSHEIYESVVDPEYPTGIVAPASGFLSGYTEIGDICVGPAYGDDPSNPSGHPGSLGVFSEFLSGVLCAEYYSNVDGECVLPTTVYDPNPGGGGGNPPPTVAAAIAGRIDTGGSIVPVPGLVFNNGGEYSIDAKIQLIFWGTSWGTQNNPSQAQLISAVQNLINGPYFTGLKQYGGINKPTYKGAVILNKSYNDNTAEPGVEVFNLINSHTITGPAEDPTVLYMFVLPKNINAVLGGAGSAYHSVDGIPTADPDVWIPFSFGVNTAPDIDSFTTNISHEISEAMANNLQGLIRTPPNENDAWVANTHHLLELPYFDEINDTCDFPFDTQNVNGVMVDPYWRNDVAGCIAPTTDVTPPPPGVFTTVLDFSRSVAGAAVKLDNSRTKVAEYNWGTNAPIYNQKLAKVEVYARKVGSPTGNLKCSIQAMPTAGVTQKTGILDESKYQEVFVFDPLVNVATALTPTVFTKITFTKLVTDDYEPQIGNAIMFEYSGGSSSNYIELALAGSTFDMLTYNGGMNLQALTTATGLWDDYLPDGINSCDLSFTAYINSGFCFGSGQPGTGGAVGVVYKQPQTYETGLPIGQMNPGDYKSIILQRTIPASAPVENDEVVEVVVGAGGTNTPDPGPGGGGNPPPTCPSGQHVDPVTNLCIPNAPPVGGCTTTIYPGTGQTMTAVDSGATTRHYASDGSSPTTEFEVNNCPFENYEMTRYGNIPSDELTMKMYGPTHSDSNRAWYLCVISANGDTHFGWEDPHPTTNKDCFSGPNIGNVGSKVIGAKAVIWKLPTGGAHVELWTDTTGVWIKRLSADNPCGKTYTKANNQQVQFRIDARPVTMTCAVVSEIKPNPSAVSATAFVYPTAQDTTNLSPTGVTGTNAVQSESNEEDNDVS